MPKLSRALWMKRTVLGKQVERASVAARQRDKVRRTAHEHIEIIDGTLLSFPIPNWPLQPREWRNQFILYNYPASSCRLMPMSRMNGARRSGRHEFFSDDRDGAGRN